MPKISIITINRNNNKGLRTTIESVVNQIFKDFEYIIIDGNSSDDSIGVIKEYESRINYWISESDKGIYDAMNKGIIKATGDYLYFLNSGDIFPAKNVLSEIFNSNVNSKVIIGNVLFNYKTGEKLTKNHNITIDYMALYGVNHQSVFFHKDIFDKYKGYNCRYKIAADFEIILKALIDEEFKYQYFDLTICKFDTTGLSSQTTNHAVIHKEKMLIRESIYPSFVWKSFEEMYHLRYQLHNIRLSKIYKIAGFLVKVKERLI